ncbi:monofunctional biosynthetic peptidoglycan transglycosylase [Imhoffiella purpurea]|uniref:Biosynthetic peptidoglycan transglycosylase n=1 Tax=Imhoffiella purpurea TaxID=1249627 RepID=W9V5N2_9GAMM|nr:monofunctional biosynthetic peptidoglycan transglycosylase [Imhoffiella purpurea]EXJ14679.1 Monofunctional biosynthetic peptidoglycan transglycosylase [Imhoffiella purpurea]
MLRKLLRWTGWLAGGFLALSLVSVGALRWLDPPTSSFMLQHWLAGKLGLIEGAHVRHEWVDWSRIPPEMAVAVMAAEDQRFPQHRGFDLVEIRRALERFESGGRLRGASTISQQTAKNLFLWSGRDYVRKGLEVWLTFLVETLWSKQRILEVYLNIAQFGPDTFGVGAASWQYFDRPVQAIGTGQASLLAAVLPNPVRYRVDRPSAWVLKRADWIRQQMANLGGASYLDRL